MSQDDKKEIYTKKKPIVTEFEGVKYSIIQFESESSTEGEAKLGWITGLLNFRGKRDTKRIVQAVIVSDPRLPINGPVPFSGWEQYINSLLLKKGDITEYIAETVTQESGVSTISSDVVVKVPVYRDLPKEKAESFIKNSEAINPKLKYETQPPESGRADSVDIWTYISEVTEPIGSEQCQVCGESLPYLSNKCRKCGATNIA